MEVYKVEKLTKKYNKQVVLDELNLSLGSGQFVALLGANGSGKSTFLRLLAQDEQPNSGNIFYHNQNLQSITVNCRENVLFIDENHFLPLDISLEQWAYTFSKQYVRYDMSVFYDLMKRFDVDIYKTFLSLSRGQKMKALFALQAPKKPTVYLIDEITSVLDVGSRLEMMSFLKQEVISGALVVMSTNIGSELQSIATNVCYLRSGKMVLSCKSEELKNRFIKYRTTDAVSEKNLVQASARLISVNSDGSKSFLASVNTKVDSNLATNVQVDKRAVTIEDVAAYYTIQEMVSGSF
jgi:ABC-2 type transport system ATP-binding protein